MAASSQKSRKVKALLAGGLVLGVGAAVTLAAWTDQEWVKGTFSAGNFNVQGSPTGSNYADHETSENAATLTFEVNPENLSPSDVVAAPFALQSAPDSDYAASVKLTAATAGEGAENLTYQVIQVADIASCTPTATGTEVLPAGTAIDSVEGATAFTLPKSADGVLPGDTTTLCFKVTAGDGLVEGQVTNTQWTLTATSL